MRTVVLRIFLNLHSYVYFNQSTLYLVIIIDHHYSITTIVTHLLNTSVVVFFFFSYILSIIVELHVNFKHRKPHFCAVLTHKYICFFQNTMLLLCIWTMYKRPLKMKWMSIYGENNIRVEHFENCHDYQLIICASFNRLLVCK